jgi:hypothetical protein
VPDLVLWECILHGQDLVQGQHWHVEAQEGPGLPLGPPQNLLRAAKGDTVAPVHLSRNACAQQVTMTAASRWLLAFPWHASQGVCVLTRGAAVSDIDGRPLVILQAGSCRIDVCSVLDIPCREHLGSIRKLW